MLTVFFMEVYIQFFVVTNCKSNKVFFSRKWVNGMPLADVPSENDMFPFISTRNFTQNFITETLQKL